MLMRTSCRSAPLHRTKRLENAFIILPIYSLWLLRGQLAQITLSVSHFPPEGSSQVTLLGLPSSQTAPEICRIQVQNFRLKRGVNWSNLGTEEHLNMFWLGSFVIELFSHTHFCSLRRFVGGMLQYLLLHHKTYIHSKQVEHLELGIPIYFQSSRKSFNSSKPVLRVSSSLLLQCNVIREELETRGILQFILKDHFCYRGRNCLLAISSSCIFKVRKPTYSFG